MTPNPKTKLWDFTVVEAKEINFDPEFGTIQNGQGACPLCSTVAAGSYLRTESKAGRMGHQLIAVAASATNRGKVYRNSCAADESHFANACCHLEHLRRTDHLRPPDEPITPDRPSPNSRGLSGVARYGVRTFGELFNERQATSLLYFVRSIRAAKDAMRQYYDPDHANAIVTLLASVLDWFTDKSTTMTRWHNSGEKISGTFSKQAVAMVWDYAEVNPFTEVGAGFPSGLAWTVRVLNNLGGVGRPAQVQRTSAARVPSESGALDAVICDPPYYDAVPYSDLSDFFYCWLKRTVGDLFPEMFRTPLTPKAQELIAYYGKGERKVNKTREWYEVGMREAFGEAQRVVGDDGICAVMFAHTTTAAWEAVIKSLLDSRLLVVASWPLHTEMTSRTVARNAAALASSVTIVCRKRRADAGEGFWDDVRGALREVSGERLDFFWNQGIRGADFFISAIGPALSVFGRYERVVRLSGEEVTVGQFLDEVRDLVTRYALAKIVRGGQVGRIDAESQFYVVWRWSYGAAKVPADEAFKLAQALGLDTERMWDKTGVLEKSGQNVSAVPITKRLKIKHLGEPAADGAPASLIDALHRLCAFRDKGDTPGMGEFLGRSGYANNHSLWLVAQAVSEILPDGDKEKQLMQGLLNQREGLEEATRQRRLF